MGYRDDFYCMRNFHGYTGRLHDFPTLYFLKRLWIGGVFYGHVTQKHELPGNVGRMPVEGPDTSYSAVNEPHNGGRLVERDRHGVFHVSRNPIILRAAMNQAQLAMCEKILRECVHEKYISTYSPRDQHIIDTQRQLHQAIITPAALMGQIQRMRTAADQRAAHAARMQQMGDFQRLRRRVDASALLARQRRGL